MTNAPSCRTAGSVVMGKRRCRHSWIPCHLQKRKCCSIVTTFQTKRKYDRSSDDVVTSTLYLDCYSLLFPGNRCRVCYPICKSNVSGLFFPPMAWKLNSEHRKYWAHRSKKALNFYLTLFILMRLRSEIRRKLVCAQRASWRGEIKGNFFRKGNGHKMNAVRRR